MHLQVRRRGLGAGQTVGGGARIGVLGGVFNPPHVGHLVCAQEAHTQLGLELVLWIPVGSAPHREVADDPGAEVRLRLCELAVAGDERFEVSRLEVEREGPSYTVDTLRELAAEGRELVLILGSDQALAFPTWHAPGEVLELAVVAVAARGGAARSDVQERFDELGGGDRLRFFDMPRIDVSSTLVRRHAAAGRPIRYLVPDAVAQHVRERGLYASSVGAGAG